MIENGAVFKAASDEAFSALAQDLNLELRAAGLAPRLHFAPSGFSAINGAYT